MIDVNKITSTLAKLPDAMLQKYAQMHKADPYIMALAMSESNRRKELRSAGQSAQGVQEQPKVVDREISQMAPQQMPEDRGIGRLNAGNMNFANGGIIAFADGGDVERYAGMYGSLTGEGAMYDPATGLPVYDSSSQGGKDDRTMLERIGLFNPENRRALERGERAAAQKASAMPYNRATMPTAGYNRPAMANDPRMLPPTTGAAPTVDTTRKASGSGPVTAATEGPQGIDALQAKYFSPLDQDVGALRNQRAGLAAGIQDLADQDAAATKAAIEKRGDVYKNREDRLSKQEKSLEGMGDKYMGLALLQAGAAMMTTPGGIGAALGKGVQVGSERYVAGLDKIEAAKSKFAEARDRLDDLRINRDDMNAKDIRQAEAAARAAKLKGQELFYDGAVKDLGIKEKQVTAVFGAAATALNNDKDIASRERISRAQIAAANRTPAEIQMVERVMKEKNIPFTEALALLSSSKREGVSEEKLRGEWLDSAKRMQIAQDYPNVKTFEDYKTVMGMGGGGGGFKLVGVR